MLKSIHTLITFTALTVSGSAFANESLCQAYAKANSADTLTLVKTVESTATNLTAEQKGLIQSTILVGNPTQPVTVAQALKEFSDDGGSNAGSLVYSTLTFNDKTRTVASVTYYPGDNQYGALYSISTYHGKESANLIGIVGDGDISCLTYTE